MRLWPRSSSTSVARSWLVLLVAMQFALCSLLVADRPKIFGIMVGMEERRMWRLGGVMTGGVIFRRFFYGIFSHSVQLDIEWQAGGGSDSRCSVTPIRCMLGHIDKDISSTPRPHHHHQPSPPRSLTCPLRATTDACFDGAVNCGGSAVAVHRRSSTSMS